QVGTTWNAWERNCENGVVYAGRKGEALVFDQDGNAYRGNLSNSAQFTVENLVNEEARALEEHIVAHFDKLRNVSRISEEAPRILSGELEVRPPTALEQGDKPGSPAGPLAPPGVSTERTGQSPGGQPQGIAPTEILPSAKPITLPAEFVNAVRAQA